MQADNVDVRSVSMLSQYVRPFVFCGMYVVVSAGLIDFNKFLMHPDRFPYAMALTTMHMATSTMLCCFFYLVLPSWFPAMEATKGKRFELFKWFLPLGSFFAIGLFASNQAYIYCSVAFLQFMKEANIVIVFTMACAVGLQVATRARLVVIAWIIAGATMAVQGEIRFVFVGFVFQAVSQLGECSKNVMGEWLLAGQEFKLDPLTYTMFMAPVCLVILMVGNLFVWEAQVIPSAINWWHYLLPNSMMAFVLNLVVATVIKECSAVGFILAGLVKDIIIVSASSFLFGDVISSQQVVGFLITLGGVFFWSYMKIAPDAPAVSRLQVLLREKKGMELVKSASETNEEKEPLMTSKAV